MPCSSGGGKSSHSCGCNGGSSRARKDMLFKTGRLSSQTGNLYWITMSFLLFTTLFIDAVSAIDWLVVREWDERHWNKTADCTKKKTAGFVKTHRNICQRNLELMRPVVHAATQTMQVCQELFADRRWNCSTIESAPAFLPDLTKGSREQAFVYALSSAAIVQSIAKACSLGITTSCGCGRLPNEPPPGNFKWGGCGDDLRFGLLFGSTFADAPFQRKTNSKIAAINKHNNAVGRLITQRSLQTKCKCHGVSGSCSIKTCWKELPPLKSVGETIRQKYSVAREVKARRSRDNPKLRILRPVHGRKKVAEDDLVYLIVSPDYCLPDSYFGSLGTYGRECRKDETGSSGCQSMCCGRGFTSQVVTIKYRCECKYYWCCYVKCKTCTKKVEINRCR